MAILAICLVPGAIFAQADYVLSMTSFDAAQGGSGDIRVLFDNVGNSSIQGWSYGSCHDINALTLSQVAAGSTTATVNNGDEPGFLALNVEPGGYTMGHTSHLFLFDPRAGFANSWPYGTPAEEILADLRERI